MLVRLSSIAVPVASVLGTIVMYVGALWLNMHLFGDSEFVRGINWIYLPAGVRLLSTLLLAEYGAIGLILAGWITNFGYFFPHDPVRAFLGGLISSGTPYLIYKVAQRWCGLAPSLSNLTSGRLFLLMLAYAILDPLAMHIWFALKGQTAMWICGLVAMSVGNLIGTMLVIYTLKVGLAVLARGRLLSTARKKAQERIRP